jgi:hypothetical protein
MGLENIDITNRGVEDRRETVVLYEAKLAAAKKQRETLLIDMRKASARADGGDRPARLELASLSKQDAAVGRLVLSIEAQLEEARKRVGLAEAQVDAVRAHATVPSSEGAERLFLVNTLHNLHQVRHKARTIESLRSRFH